MKDEALTQGWYDRCEKNSQRRHEKAERKGLNQFVGRAIRKVLIPVRPS